MSRTFVRSSSDCGWAFLLLYNHCAICFSFRSLQFFSHRTKSAACKGHTPSPRRELPSFRWMGWPELRPALKPGGDRRLLAILRSSLPSVKQAPGGRSQGQSPGRLASLPAMEPTCAAHLVVRFSTQTLHSVAPILRPYSLQSQGLLRSLSSIPNDGHSAPAAEVRVPWSNVTCATSAQLAALS